MVDGRCRLATDSSFDLIWWYKPIFKRHQTRQTIDAGKFNNRITTNIAFCIPCNVEFLGTNTNKTLIIVSTLPLRHSRISLQGKGSHLPCLETQVRVDSLSHVY